MFELTCKFVWGEYGAIWKKLILLASTTSRTSLTLCKEALSLIITIWLSHLKIFVRIMNDASRINCAYWICVTGPSNHWEKLPNPSKTAVKIVAALYSE